MLLTCLRDSTYRDLEYDHRLSDRLSAPKRLDHQQAHCRQRQQQAHLDIQTGGVEKAAQMPLIALVAVDCGPQSQHSKAVIETPQHKDAMQPLAQNEQREYVWWDLSSSVQHFLEQYTYIVPWLCDSIE